MSLDVESESGIIVPLRAFLPLIKGKHAELLHTCIIEVCDELSILLEQDDEVLGQQGFYREGTDFVRNTVFVRYFRELLEISERTDGDFDHDRAIAVAFGACIEEAGTCVGLEMCHILNHIFRQVFGENTIPRLSSIIVFNDQCWGLHSLMSWSDGPLAELSPKEISSEMHQKPCFIFDERECFQVRVDVTPKGKRFKKLLGVSSFETSEWTYLSY